jgi:hypothetical protein
VREKENRREQADHGEADAVRVGELVRDRAHVGDVPAGGEPDGAPRRDGSDVHAAVEPEMIAAMAAPPPIGRLY